MRSSHALANAVRMQSRAAANAFARPKMGIISSYDGEMSVKVMVQPEGVESGWMPLGCIGIGGGWGLAVGPNIGDQVVIVYPEGDHESGVIVGRFFSVAQPPIPVPAGEIWAVHQSTSSMKLTNDGKVAVNSQSDTNITVGGNAKIVVAGNASYTATTHQFTGPVTMSSTLSVAQDITDQAGSGNTETMSAMRSKYNEHDHAVDNVQSGSSTVETNTPTPQM